MNSDKAKASQQSDHRAASFLETAIPGIRVARTYQHNWLRFDLIAAVTIFAMLVPQGMAYGELAGVTPVVGLYAAMGAMLGYALFGCKRCSSAVDLSSLSDQTIFIHRCVREYRPISSRYRARKGSDIALS